MRFSLALLGFCICTCVSGCRVGGGSATPRCDDAGGCPAGTRCHRGFCIGGGEACAVEGMVRPCFDGDPTLVGVGACRDGEQQCRGGAFTACLGQVAPREEICNGADDDCDGTADDLEPTPCMANDEGLCQEGELACRMGSGVCMALVEPALEVCDGMEEDEDCDGATDEETEEECYPAGAMGCTEMDGVFTCDGTCATGRSECVGGAPSACAGAVTPAATDGCTASGTAVDDDCDGATDEDCECTPGAMQPCYSGPMGSIMEPCRAGTQTCGAGMRFGDCEGEVAPALETCMNDGADDDCDGAMDDVPTRGMACLDMMRMGECRFGRFDCTGGTLACVTPGVVPERCNERDDDCDGRIDETFMTATDRMNCGGCGIVCGEGLDCCGGDCVDADEEEENCGGCGIVCGTGETCCGGDCVDLTSDAENCNACGNACGEGLSCCNSACTDTRSDPLNCGSCGGGPCGGTDLCCGGSCAAPTAPACTGCAVDCSAMGQSCCGGSCADTMTDESHCGGCGAPCDAGDVCCGGTCHPAGDPMHCGQDCTDCPGDDLCCAGSCAPRDAAHCNSCTEVCGGGEACCGSPTDCTDLGADEMNCGMCGMACSGTQTCASGHCCPSGNIWCDGCTNPATDRNNCGRCGNRCGVLQTCCSGTCRTLC